MIGLKIKDENGNTFVIKNLVNNSVTLKNLAGTKEIASHELLFYTIEKKYSVKCDECKKVIDRTNDIKKSYAGGKCNSCKKILNK